MDDEKKILSNYVKHKKFTTFKFSRVSFSATDETMQIGGLEWLLWYEQLRMYEKNFRKNTPDFPSKIIVLIRRALPMTAIKMDIRYQVFQDIKTPGKHLKKKQELDWKQWWCGTWTTHEIQYGEC